jgi:hypothetical protein
MKYVATFTIIKDDKKREITKFFNENATLHDIMNSDKFKILSVVIEELKDEFDWIDKLKKDLNNMQI